MPNENCKLEHTVYGGKTVSVLFWVVWVEFHFDDGLKSWSFNAYLMVMRSRWACVMFHLSLGLRVIRVKRVL